MIAPSARCLRFLRSLIFHEVPLVSYAPQRTVFRQHARFRGQTSARGLKTKSTKELSAISNIEHSKSQSHEHAFKEFPIYPTVVQQALDNMKRYDNCVLLTRVGSFYEVSR